MASVTHGGRALTFAREHNTDVRNVLDFSANINPLGPSPKAIEAIQHGLDVIGIYPDETPVRLIRALSERLRVPVNNVLAGNGATDLLYFWARTIRPRKVTLVVPTFTEYRKALESIGAEVETIELQSSDLFRLPRCVSNADAVIITNPNNPTGAYAPPEEMFDWIGAVPASTQILIDEAFVEFTAQPSLVRHTERFSNLWVLRSMTKFYALPGLRLGYLVGAGIPRLGEQREPWQVNTLAEIAALASLEDRSYEEATIQLIQRERIWLWKQLQSVAGIEPYSTAANFFFIRSSCDATLDRLIESLAENNILIRDCRNIEGLDGPYFRIAIRSRQDNTLLLDYLRRA
jgi:threonine-phosphate decarboxylase